MTLKDKLIIKAKKKLVNLKADLESKKVELEEQILITTSRIKDIEENFDKLVEEEVNKALDRENKKAKKREMLKKFEEQYKQEENKNEEISFTVAEEN